MKALLPSAPGTLALADVDTPSPAAGEVLVRIAACGICGYDVHGYTGGSGRRERKEVVALFAPALPARETLSVRWR